MWMFGSRTTVKKVRNSLTWFSHGSGAILLQSLWREFLFLLQECLRLGFLWTESMRRGRDLVGHRAGREGQSLTIQEDSCQDLASGVMQKISIVEISMEVQLKE